MMGEKMKLVPLEVSPLIKLVRWSCLIAGVIHGFNNQRKYVALEESQREHKERLRREKEEEIARERARRNEADIREIQRIFLGIVPDDEESNQKTVPRKDESTQTIDDPSDESVNNDVS